MRTSKGERKKYYLDASGKLEERNGRPKVVGSVGSVGLSFRRVALYQRVPRSARRFGSSSQYTTTYTSLGGNLPEQDEIILIERELNYRYGKGDKAAYFERQVPYVPPVQQQAGGT